MTLTEFLLARLDDDVDAWQMVRDREVTMALTTTFRNVPLAERMLADLEAKRRIVELHAEAASHTLAHGAPTNHEARAGALADVIQLLAQAYQDHEDFQEGWKP